MSDVPNSQKQPLSPPQAPGLQFRGLAGVFAELDPATVRVLGAEPDSSRALGSCVLYDETEHSTSWRDAIVLGLGVPPQLAAVEEVLHRLGSAGAAALVLREPVPDLEHLAEVAVSLGVTLAVGSPSTSWNTLAPLVYAAAASAATWQAGGTQAPGSDLSRLANAVAAMVGGAVTIEDPARVVLAYSTLPDQPIDSVRADVILQGRAAGDRLDTYRKVWRAHGPVRFEPPGHAARLAIAVRAGAEVLGTIWAIEGHTPLSDDANAALVSAARTVALTLLQHRATRHWQRDARARHLYRLLNGGPLDMTELALLGLSEADSCQIMANAIPASVDAAAAAAAADLIATASESVNRAASTVTLRRTVYTLLPMADTRSTDGEKLAPELVQVGLRSLNFALKCAVTNTFATTEVPRAREQADRLLRALERNPTRGRFADYDDLRDQVALEELAEHLQGMDQARDSVVALMAQRDAADGTAYVKTLRIFLDASGHMPTAAERLSLHPNSLRYRLDRMRALFGIDFDDQDQRLLLWVHSRLLDIAATSVEPAAPSRRVVRRRATS